MAKKDLNKSPEVRTMEQVYKEFKGLKAIHSGGVLFVRNGDFYDSFGEDAVKAHNTLGITLTKSDNLKDKGEQVAYTTFPYMALDLYLPKMVRAGHRVQICDLLESK